MDEELRTPCFYEPDETAETGRHKKQVVPHS